MDVLLNRTAAFLFSCAFYSKERTAAQPGSAKGPRIYSDSPRLPRTASEERFRLILDGNDASPLQAAGPKPNGALWWGHQQGSLESWPLPSGSASQHSLQGLPSQSLWDGGWREGLRPRVTLTSSAWPHVSLLTSLRCDMPSALLREAGSNLPLKSPNLRPHPAQFLDPPVRSCG